MTSLVENLCIIIRLYWKKFAFLVATLDPSVLFVTAVSGIFVFLYLASLNCQQLFFTVLRKCPILCNIVQRKIDSAIADVYRTIHGDWRVEYQTHLSDNGLPCKAVLQKLRKYKAAEYIRWNEGYTSGTVYPKEIELDEFAAEVFKEFIWTNPLHADIFPDVRRMEAEVVRMCLSMYHGDDESCGTTTSGGTESIMLACLAYRELARTKGIKKPVMLIPSSAHPAFDKAAHYFGIEVCKIPVNAKSLKVDVAAMKSAITSNVCMLVGSAPGFPHGIIDPIVQISELGHRYGIPVHVDCCLGGFLLPFMDEAGFPIEPFDFRLPGVTSISCDTHKYGFAAKGTSVIMYRNKYYRSMQFFTQTTWSGGLYASPTLAGSRSGALIAVCWATMMHFGRRGYVNSTHRIVKTTRLLAEQLRRIQGLVVLGVPQVCVIAFTSEVFDIYRLSAELSEMPNGRGWSLNNLQFPPAVHLCVTDLHTVEGRAEAFIRDVRLVVDRLMENPVAPAKGAAAMYAMCATIPDRSIVSDVAKGYLDACYDTPACVRHTPNPKED